MRISDWSSDVCSSDLSWPRQIPIAGTPADVVAIARDYAGWLSESPIPKLFINAEPGHLTTGRIRDFCRTWPNQTEITVAGAHFIQEDSTDEIGAAIAAFVRRLRPAKYGTGSFSKNRTNHRRGRANPTTKHIGKTEKRDEQTKRDEEGQ